MKKKIGNYVMALLAVVLCVNLSSCNKDDEGGYVWDVAPLGITIVVEDENGNNLLDPSVPGNIVSEDIRAIYKGEVYEKDALAQNPQSKAIPAIFRGLYTVEPIQNSYYCLRFGDFKGSGKYDNEEVTIEWYDGTKDTFRFSAWTNAVDQKDPIFYRNYWLNGKDCGNNDGVFKLIKSPKK